MIGKRVEVKVSGKCSWVGIVLDKVNIPLASGTNSYCPMDSYLIKDEDNDVHVVNPIHVSKIHS